MTGKFYELSRESGLFNKESPLETYIVILLREIVVSIANDSFQTDDKAQRHKLVIIGVLASYIKEDMQLSNWIPGEILLFRNRELSFKDPKLMEAFFVALAANGISLDYRVYYMLNNLFRLVKPLFAEMVFRCTSAQRAVHNASFIKELEYYLRSVKSQYSSYVYEEAKIIYKHVLNLMMEYKVSSRILDELVDEVKADPEIKTLIEQLDSFDFKSSWVDKERLNRLTKLSEEKIITLDCRTDIGVFSDPFLVPSLDLVPFYLIRVPVGQDLLH